MIYMPCISEENELRVGKLGNTASKIVKRAFSVNFLNGSYISMKGFALIPLLIQINHEVYFHDEL